MAALFSLLFANLAALCATFWLRKIALSRKWEHEDAWQGVVLGCLTVSAALVALALAT